MNTTTDTADESAGKLGDILRDPNVWGRARIVAIQLADAASSALLRNGDQSRVRAVVATLIGCVNTALFFGDMLGLHRADLERIVERAMRLHYPPTGAVEAPAPPCPVVHLRPVPAEKK